MPESFFDDQSRVDKYNKKRKNTKLINTFIVLGGFLFLLFLFFVVFGDDEEKNSPEKEAVAENDTSELSEEVDSEDEAAGEEDASTEPETEEEKEDSVTDEDSEAEEEEDSTNSEAIEESDDPNVIETIVLDWQPIGTVQEEPHVATYDTSSQDWKEMWAAARYATGLSEDDTVEWWATNNGDEHSAKLTISNKAQTETYRVYMEWVTNEGWKPVKVELLKENDIKEKHFSSNEETKANQDAQAQQEESEEQ
ncbi:YrrS family protein [Salirhabdus sp. Marseille-P4669]|uniref:YrrS family protein n=1 Tax=Salirhabdus sp. Marseille-P4669 TaxID=2042310 RepID=UPI001356B637|nr:YrrS family protein [Salirhabdus sp. Marseille-P4669]